MPICTPIWPCFLIDWHLLSLWYLTAQSPTKSLFPPRNVPSPLSQPRLHKQRGYLTFGISLLWQALWDRTPSRTALNWFSYIEIKGVTPGFTIQGSDPGWYTLMCLNVISQFILFFCFTVLQRLSHTEGFISGIWALFFLTSKYLVHAMKFTDLRLNLKLPL